MKLIKWLREKHKDLKNLNSLISKKIEEMEKKDIFRQETQETLIKLLHNQNLIIGNEIKTSEMLEKQEERIIEIIKMLMSLKDKL